MLSTIRQSYSATEWMTSTQAFLDFAGQNGHTAFSFAFRPSAAQHFKHRFDGILTLDNDILVIDLDQVRSMNWEDLRTSIINFTMPRNTYFLQAFGEARARFSAGWAVLEERESILHQQYQSVQAQLQDKQGRLTEALSETPTAHEQLVKGKRQLAELRKQGS
ncbi:hypothetical protein LSM04_007774 [Trypanosoma melophagium]|nr:hypothetical protein LSM04_007774 [Trypanosoma melophagium]